MKVAELKEHCAQRGLMVSGKKKDLQDRLAADMLIKLREKKAKANGQQPKEAVVAATTEQPKGKAAKRRRVSAAAPSAAAAAAAAAPSSVKDLVAFAKGHRTAWLAWLPKVRDEASMHACAPTAPPTALCNLAPPPGVRAISSLCLTAASTSAERYTVCCFGTGGKGSRWQEVRAEGSCTPY